MEVVSPLEVCEAREGDKDTLCLFQVLLVNLREGTFLMSVSIWVQSPLQAHHQLSHSSFIHVLLMSTSLSTFAE